VLVAFLVSAAGPCRSSGPNRCPGRFGGPRGSVRNALNETLVARPASGSRAVWCSPIVGVDGLVNGIAALLAGRRAGFVAADRFSFRSYSLTMLGGAIILVEALLVGEVLRMTIVHSAVTAACADT